MAPSASARRYAAADVGLHRLSLGRSLARIGAWRFAVLVVGLGLGVFSLAVARGGAGNSFGGGSAFAGAAELAAGYALLGVGVAAWMRPRQARLGAILAGASFAWFLLEWN